MKRFFSVQELRMTALPCGAFLSGEKIFSAQGKRAAGTCLKDGLSWSCGQGKRVLRRRQVSALQQRLKAVF